MKNLRILLLLIILFSIVNFTPPTADAAGCTDIACAVAEYQEQEQYLFCISRDTGVSVGLLTVAKLNHDYLFGVEHQLTGEQWAASYGQRVQAFTDMLGTPNPTDADGTPNHACQRLIDMHARLLELVYTSANQHYGK